MSPDGKARIIDVHTHNFTPRWVDMLKSRPDADTRIVPGNPHEVIDYRGAPIVRLSPEMTDFDMRIAAMDENGVDVAIVSLTCPHVFWGDKATSLQTAREINEDFAAAKAKYGDRIEWMAALPWQYPDAAIDELKRARDEGAVGVCLLTNISGRQLDDPLFAPVWEAVEQSGLPAFIHPTTPYVDIEAMGITDFGLSNTIGFTTDSSLAFARIIVTGFIDRFPGLKLIACHGGGALPYLIARFDQMWANTRSNRMIHNPPSTYLKRFWYDAIVYDQKTLDFLVQSVGADRLLYGSDYPFLIQDMPGVKKRVATLPAAQSAAIFEGNAASLFGI